MELVFSTKKVDRICNDLKEAKKYFGGNADLSRSLMARINALREAENLKDIVVQPPFHFHKLYDVGKNKLDGCFAIDVKSRREPWRIILRPLDNNKEPLTDFNIDAMAETVEIVEIREVSKHYE